ncbi:MAG TPA: rod shape-determining protein MreD [Capsulimonadaceae bacterium]|jgi:rod shape-determining protein MreD
MIAKRLIVFVLTLVVAATLQGSASAAVAIHHARPDFLLIAITCLGLLTSPAQGITAGLCGGVAMGALAGVNYGTFMVSRIAAGWAAGQIGRTMNRESLVTPFVTMLVTTIGAQVIAFVMAPYNPGYWAITSLGELAYNLVLVVPIYAALQRLIRPKRPRDPYVRRIRRRR